MPRGAFGSEWRPLEDNSQAGLVFEEKQEKPVAGRGGKQRMVRRAVGEGARGVSAPGPHLAGSRPTFERRGAKVWDLHFVRITSAVVWTTDHRAQEGKGKGRSGSSTLRKPS